MIKLFEKRDKQHIHLADTNLCQEKYDPENIIEDHEKKMRNLPKKVHNLGGSSYCQCHQGGDRTFVVPGVSSADTFTYLHTLWYKKEEEWDAKRVKTVMAAHNHSTNTPQPNQIHSGNRPIITCHNRGKPGHIAKKCWAKGGGMEGQGPKQGHAGKPRAGTNANAANSDEDNNISMPMYTMPARDNSKPNRLIPF
ncbi:hypothetical protein F5877DRAFT_72718 [Lentinula edodes]|nr:hypothetical protein F5877DRAFT_72718 [Lentinula edodes]